MATPDQKRRLLTAKIAVTLHDEPGRVPTTEEIEQVVLRTQVRTRPCWGCPAGDRSNGTPASWRSSSGDARAPAPISHAHGYARVSTLEQTLALQQGALTKAGCQRLFTNTASGSQAVRPGL